MSSILTNNGAMVALQTLKSINNDLSKTQSIISTGKSVGSAKDNAAIWAISKVMESDVQGFKSIQESLDHQQRGFEAAVSNRSQFQHFTRRLKFDLLSVLVIRSLQETSDGIHQSRCEFDLCRTRTPNGKQA